MPPPMPNPSKRMTANPARPVARYRPGKALREESASEEDESGGESEVSAPPKLAQPKASSFPAGGQKPHAPRKAFKEESEDEEGFVTEDEDDGDTGGVPLSVAGVTDGADKLNPKPNVNATSRTNELPYSDSENKDESGQSEEDSEKEEDTCSTEEPQRKFQRPTFIKKSDRGKATSSAVESSKGVVPGVISTSPAVDTIRADEARRKEMADLMIKDKLERDAAARAAGRKGWDDDDELAADDMVDDTDGLDPEAEYAAWKLRELKRLKRDREAIEQREKEIEETERRKNLTQAEREAEDRDYLDQQKEEREDGRGKAGFLQRYHHKGAFFQDDETAEILRKRDLMGARFVDEVQNREALPQYMQVRDMTKLGKKGRTRYIDLRGEDTGNWGQGYDQREQRGQATDFGVDERFRPDHGGGVNGPTGANASTVRDRRDVKVDGAPEGPRAMKNPNQNMHGDTGNSHRPGRYSIERTDEHDKSWKPSDSSSKGQASPSRRRSRSPSGYQDRYRGEDDTRRRKRSLSPFGSDDKRRRVDAG